MLIGGSGAATWQANAEASNSSIARVPLTPRVTWSQKRSRPTPNGDTTPMPVMAMRGRTGAVRTIMACL